MFYEVWHLENGVENGIAYSGCGKMVWCTLGVEDGLEHGLWKLSIMMKWMGNGVWTIDISILVTDNGL